MDRKKLEECGINYEEGLARFAGSEKIYEKYLKKLENLDLYEEMKAACARGDVEAAFRATHNLKAFIGNLSIPAIYENVLKLTELFRAGELAGSEDIIKELDKQLAEVVEVIKSME